MPVTKQNTGRVVAAPARCKRYNIPDSELKGFGLRVEPPRQDGGGHKAWYVQAMAGGRRGGFQTRSRAGPSRSRVSHEATTAAVGSLAQSLPRG